MVGFLSNHSQILTNEQILFWVLRVILTHFIYTSLFVLTMSAFIIYVWGREKKLAKPIPKNYEIGLLDICYKFKKPDKKILNPPNYVNVYRTEYSDSIAIEVVELESLEEEKIRHFNIICDQIEPSIISGSLLRNLVIHRSSLKPFYTEFKKIEYHKLYNNDLKSLSFEWPDNIEIKYFTLMCRPSAKNS